MKNLMTTIIGASMLAVSFGIQAEEVSLDDMYLNEHDGIHDVDATYTPRRNVDVTLDDMYGYNEFDEVDHDDSDQKIKHVAGSF